MKIAFVLSTGKHPMELLYVEQVRSSCEAVLRAGNTVSVFLVGGVSDRLDGFPAEVQWVAVDVPSYDERKRYWSQAHAQSDKVLRRLIECASASPFDAVEFSLWGALAFTTVRSKRLLDMLAETKICCHALMAHAWADPGSDSSGSLDSALLAEMESYVVRHCDQLFVPTPAMGESLKSLYGRTHYCCVGWSGLEQWIEGLSDCHDAVTRQLREFVLQKPEHGDPKPPAGVSRYEGDGKRRYRRRANRGSLTVLTLAAEADGGQFDFQALQTLSLKTLQWLVTPGGVGLKELLAQINCELVLWMDPSVKVSPDWIQLAVEALLQHPELAYIGSYAKCAQIYPLGLTTGLSSLIPTASPLGGLYRKSALLRIADWMPAEGSTLHWDLQLALQTQFQHGDIIPHPYMVLQSNPNLALGEVTGPAWMLQRHQRLWKSQASKLLLTAAAEPQLLTCWWDAYAYNPTPDWEYDLWGIAGAVESSPEASSVKSVPDEKVAASMPEAPPEPIVVPEVQEQDLASAADEIPLADPVSEPLPPEAMPMSEDELLEAAATMVAPMEDGGVEGWEAEIPVVVPESTPFEVLAIEVEPLVMHSAPPVSVSKTEPVAEPVLPVADADPVVPALRSRAADPEAGRSASGKREVPASPKKSMVSKGFLERVGFNAQDERNSKAPPARGNPKKEPETPVAVSVPAVTEPEDDPDGYKFRLYWSKGQRFRDRESASKFYEERKTLELHFEVQSEQDVDSLRLNPCDCEGRILLKSIEVVDLAASASVFLTCEDTAFDGILPVGDFEVDGVIDDRLILLSQGQDPQILIHLPGGKLRHFSVRVQFGFESI
jgi:hypothetical protein